MSKSPSPRKRKAKPAESTMWAVAVNGRIPEFGIRGSRSAARLANRLWRNPGVVVRVRIQEIGRG